ncbi:hypothetical protein [Comamonas humi]
MLTDHGVHHTIDQTAAVDVADQTSRTDASNQVVDQTVIPDNRMHKSILSNDVAKQAFFITAQ